MLHNQVVVAKGDGSFYWEELAGDANRTVDVSGKPLSVTCHMGGDTEVSGSGGGGSGTTAAQQSASQPGDRPSAIDMSVDMDAARELNPSFSVQVPILQLPALVHSVLFRFCRQ